MKAILTAAWAAVLFVTSLPVSAAQQEWDARTVRVDYSDLNLTSPRGISTLEHRVSGAIRQVCDEPAFELREKLHQQGCRRSTRIAASSAMHDAIAAARQLPSTTAMEASPFVIDDEASPALKQQPWYRHNRIPPR